MRGARALLLVSAIAALTSAAGAQTPLPPQPRPQLQLNAPPTNVTLNAATRRAGAFSAGGIAWRCEGQTCTSSTLTAPTLAACRALAAEVGAVASYVRQRAALSATDIAACNQSAAAAPPRVIQPGVRVTGTVDRAITTPEISFVGGAVTGPRVAGPTVNVATGEISFVGGAMVAAPVRGPSVEVTTGEIVFVGR